MNILVTGAAGFIGWKVCEFLLTKPELIPLDNQTIQPPNYPTIVGIDNMNDYYDVRLKQWRLDQLKKYPNFHFHKLDIENYNALKQLFQQYTNTRPVISNNEKQSQNDTVQCAQGRCVITKAASETPKPQPPFFAIINLAARAGVRYSMENPFVYFTTNTIGNLNLLELCKEYNIKKYVFASTSSLYAGQKMPFKEDLPVNEPISPYAASKKGAEVTCYTYNKLYGMDVTVLRYFTVYGPAGRPDMSIFRFITWIDQGKPVIIFGDGNQSRDFTYVDDIARGTIKALKSVDHKIINLGGDEPHKLIDALHLIEKKLNKKAKIEYELFHPADILATHANIQRAKEILCWEPQTKLEKGLKTTIDWYQENKSWAASIKL